MPKGDQSGRRPSGKHGRIIDNELRDMGYEVVRAKNHIVYAHPCGATVTVGTRPRDGEKDWTLRKARKLLEDAGVEVNGEAA